MARRITEKNGLAATHPELAAEWHPSKNSNLKPEQVTPGSNKKVWWLGKCGHEWQAVVAERSRKKGCPYCSGQRVLFGYNDLATVRPDLAREWHPTKNGELTPEQVSVGAHQKAWWLCEKGHEWQAVIGSRNQGRGCPICSNKQVLSGYNDLATVHPELAKEWHPTKNGELTPHDIIGGSNKKVWWQCSLGHEWEVSPDVRVVDKTGCPYCANKKVLPGFNDLATVNPGLAAEWHPTKNSNLKPEQVTVSSGKKVWWWCDKGHEWQAVVADRTAGKGCPICAGQQILPGFNDLATVNPEVAKEWHPTKNGALLPSAVAPRSNKKVWWLGKCGHEWQAGTASRSRGDGCPICAGKQILPGFNDLATVNPELVKEWHPTKNGDLTPEQISANSHKAVWWLCSEGYEWQATPNERTSKKTGCPALANTKRQKSMNDTLLKKKGCFAKAHPDLVAEWHPTKNGELTPELVTPGSMKRVWWRCPNCGSEWQSSVANRHRGYKNCPVCTHEKEISK